MACGIWKCQRVLVLAQSTKHVHANLDQSEYKVKDRNKVTAAFAIHHIYQVVLCALKRSYLASVDIIQQPQITSKTKEVFYDKPYHSGIALEHIDN